MIARELQSFPEIVNSQAEQEDELTFRTNWPVNYPDPQSCDIFTKLKSSREMIAHLSNLEAPFCSRLDKKKSQGENVDLYLDLHASVTSVGSFVEGKKFDDVFRMEKHLLLPKLLGKITPDFDPENCVYANEPLRPGTPIRYGTTRVPLLCPLMRESCVLRNRVVGSILSDRANCYTLYSSFHGFVDKSAFGLRVIPYTEERCIHSTQILSNLFPFRCLATFLLP